MTINVELQSTIHYGGVDDGKDGHITACVKNWTDDCFLHCDDYSERVTCEPLETFPTTVFRQSVISLSYRYEEESD